ncbi:uncharacterized protein LOC142882088 [Nelusetta ayraudi]|uniref:uncharacterized protein LOC142882088 n=1 Tax=Nelusetta ayraudi TaxID=303726 RepID=UPI003F71D450
MDHIGKWLRKTSKQEVRRQLIGRASGDGASAVGSPAHARPGAPPALDARDGQQGSAGQSEPPPTPPPVCGGRVLLEEPELHPANHTQEEAGSRDDLSPLAPGSLAVGQSAARPRPQWAVRGLPRSLPSSPLPGRWVGPCLTPPLSRCWVEAALQRSKDAQRLRPRPPQEWEGLRSEGAKGRSHQEESWHHQEGAWRYCLLSPCICLRCPSAPPYQEQDGAAATTLLYPSLSHMTIS